ncbi:MAG: hypothetical protein KJS97_15700 [Alphaproteobacteria bacterium]|nr:hypothetical protein [Alphaproteobacteria bacterium]
MRTFFLALAFLAPVAVAGAAERMSDSEYLQAARCAAYLGAEAGSLAQTVEAQAGRRDPVIRDRAETMADQISRKVRRAKTDAARAEIDAERTASCAPVQAAQAAKSEPKG